MKVSITKFIEHIKSIDGFSYQHTRYDEIGPSSWFSGI
jgi:hypothetical protein